ncbi:MAG: AbrB/MazE/SpoVT family DNA-binding domain-containing protein [Terriglobales bacterium]|jgi:AbrB family looped-hinge helix DNA binding protein
MEIITVSSKGQIAIPKAIRQMLNLQEGTKLELEIRGQELVLSKGPAWKKLYGAGRSHFSMSDFAKFRKREREHENSRF